MTRREKTPRNDQKDRRWVGKLIMGAVFLFFGVEMLHSFDRFWTGLQTYFWDQAEGQITASDLTVRDRGGWGDVTYAVTIDTQEVTRTEEVNRGWAANREKRERQIDEWTESLKVGSTVTIYYADAKHHSLGHWPAEWVQTNSVSGILYLLGGFGLILAALHERKHGRPDPRAAEKGRLAQSITIGLIIGIGTMVSLLVIESGFGVSAGGWLAGLIAAFWAFIGWLVVVGMKNGTQESPAKDAAAG